jgi:hypothetical protein
MGVGMNKIDFEIKAKNSSGEQALWLSSNDLCDEFWFTLNGDHDGKKIQIDFETMTRSDLETLSVAIQLILDCKQ